MQPTDDDAIASAPTSLAVPCPWRPYTAPVLKQVLMHMETRHRQRYLDLALSPPIAGDVF
jgi:hypothetical protein